MKIFALLSSVVFSAAQAQFFGVETGYNNTCLWEKEGLNRWSLLKFLKKEGIKKESLFNF